MNLQYELLRRLSYCSRRDAILILYGVQTVKIGISPNLWVGLLHECGST